MNQLHMREWLSWWSTTLPRLGSRVRVPSRALFIWCGSLDFYKGFRIFCVCIFCRQFVGTLNNPSFHGLSEMLYEYTSSAANNGSGFEGLSDNTYFWNYTCGIVLIMGRYLPIVGQVAIAGLLASKKFIPESAGTLKTDTTTFAVMTFLVIFIVAALSFFPALTLGPIADYLSF